MFKDTYKFDDPDPYQGGAPSLSASFTKQNYTVQFLGPDDIPAFLKLQDKVLKSLPDEQKHFLKPRSEEDLVDHMGARMPVIGVKDNDGKLVAQCIIAYPRHADAVKNLEGYPINGAAPVTAIVQSLSVDPSHAGKGLSRMILDTAKDVAAQAGLTQILSKVADANASSSRSFMNSAFEKAAAGLDPKKGYPVTYWQYSVFGPA